MSYTFIFNKCWTFKVAAFRCEHLFYCLEIQTLRITLNPSFNNRERLVRYPWIFFQNLVDRTEERWPRMDDRPLTGTIFGRDFKWKLCLDRLRPTYEYPFRKRTYTHHEFKALAPPSDHHHHYHSTFLRIHLQTWRVQDTSFFFPLDLMKWKLLQKNPDNIATSRL